MSSYYRIMLGKKSNFAGEDKNSNKYFTAVGKYDYDKLRPDNWNI